jgi:hypothetical protein
MLHRAFKNGSLNDKPYKQAEPVNGKIYKSIPDSTIMGNSATSNT